MVLRVSGEGAAKAVVCGDCTEREFTLSIISIGNVPTMFAVCCNCKRIHSIAEYTPEEE